jgi:hypothetical protein
MLIANTELRRNPNVQIGIDISFDSKKVVAFRKITHLCERLLCLILSTEEECRNFQTVFPCIVTDSL